jgi:mRNA interferase MazF
MKNENKNIPNKDFDAWNRLKKILDNKIIENNIFFKEREVWWVNIGVNIGKEIDGKNKLFERPILILTKINRHLFLGVPLTSKHKKYHSKIRYRNNNNFSFVSITQIRIFSSNRLIRKIGMIEKEDYLKTKIDFINLLIFNKKDPRYKPGGLF